VNSKRIKNKIAPASTPNSRETGYKCITGTHKVNEGRFSNRVSNIFSLREIKSFIEAGRQRKQQMDQQAKQRKISNLCQTIIEDKELRDNEIFKNLRKRRQTTFLLNFSVSFVMIVIIVSAFIGIGKLVLDNTTVFTSSPYQNLSSLDDEYIEIQKYLDRIIFKEKNLENYMLDRMWSLKINNQTRIHGIEVMDLMRHQPFKIKSIQANRLKGNYFVWCDFYEKGRLNIILEKRKEELRLAFMDFDS
jgi:hypothetical protein